MKEPQLFVIECCCLLSMKVEQQPYLEKEDSLKH